MKTHTFTRNLFAISGFLALAVFVGNAATLLFAQDTARASGGLATYVPQGGDHCVLPGVAQNAGENENRNLFVGCAGFLE